jgi:acetyl-CoA synthetase (ADP-forming)
MMQKLKQFIAKNKGKTVFLEHEVKALLKDLGFTVPEGIFLRKESADHMPPITGISFPLAAKVSSSKIVSKSEINGVRLKLENKDELKKAVSDLLQIKDAEGVLIEKMSPPGLEVIIGGIIDEQFGPVVMFGLGGVFVELFKDVAFALAPMKHNDALWLVKQVKGYKLLKGYRGNPPVDMDILMKMLVTISELIASGYVKEIDLNPVSLYDKGAMVLDAKMLLKRA